MYSLCMSFDDFKFTLGLISFSLSLLIELRKRINAFCEIFLSKNAYALYCMES